MFHRLAVRTSIVAVMPSLTTTNSLADILLEPRRMAGLVSEGMLFDIGFADGIRPVPSGYRPQAAWLTT